MRSSASATLQPMTFRSVDAAVARLGVDVHGDPRRRRRRRPAEHAQLVEGRAHPLAVDAHSRPVVHGLDDAFEPERQRDAHARRNRVGDAAGALSATATVGAGSSLPRRSRSVDGVERGARVGLEAAGLAGRRRRADERRCRRHGVRAEPRRQLRAPRGFLGHRRRLAPHVVDDRVDLAPRLAQPLLQRVVQALAELGLAIAQRLFARSDLRVRSRRAAPARAPPAGARDRARAGRWSILARCSASCASRSVRKPRAASTIDAGRPTRCAISSARLEPGRAVHQAIRRHERLRMERRTPPPRPPASSRRTTSARRSAWSRSPARRGCGSDR